MNLIESLLITILTRLFSAEQLNATLGDPRIVAILVGALVAVSGALLGAFMLLRRQSLTTDAISHTVLLGIVVAFLVMVYGFGMEPDLSSPWLIIGAALAGMATVVLTEVIQRSGLVKSDAALGLTFPLLFAVSILLIARYASNVHLDADSVLVGEIGVAWSNTNSYCLERCDPVTIAPDDPRAAITRTCVNCARGGISPRSPEAVFEERCGNCGTFSAAEAWRMRLIDTPPALVYWPKALSSLSLITLINLLFVVVFYKELKLATFDAALARSLGLRPAWLHYALLILVSITTVGAFDAVGAILVVAFFVIPAAAAYLLTDRLWAMLLIGPLIGAAAVYTGYDLARGSFLGLFHMNDVLRWLDQTIGLGGQTTWDSSISASMVLMTFVFFVLAWVLSPRYGLISGYVRRRSQQQQFADQVLLAHLFNHRDGDPKELAEATLHEHFRWTRSRMRWTLGRLRALNWVKVEDGLALLTERGAQEVTAFRRELVSHSGRLVT
jgi:manganese/zinc/iron transport system permease protein